MNLAIAMIIAYIPFMVWVIVQAIEDRKPKKRNYETSKTNDYWLR
jgi:hypothetical protein